MTSREDYTIGWISAIPTEYVAAQLFLDKHHQGVTFASQRDDNVYTLGKIGCHNVVMVSLPKGEYGTTTAATVASHMVRTFPNIRTGLMVGIAGGAPSETHDIRLGDVVVGCRHEAESGVLQYDYGKLIQQQTFQLTQSLNQSPPLLRSAVAALETQYLMSGHDLNRTINQILANNPSLLEKYSRPPPDEDRLFLAEVIHADVCGIDCRNKPEDLVRRPLRGEEPVIHYGLIASANQLMKDARIRDKLAASKGVLCFEMEAAGLMNHFPCLAIRGICDYADTHKNKIWQGYAAMTAAAYAKDLLRKLPPLEMQLMQPTAKTIVHENGFSESSKRILQLFRLVSTTHDTTYEWYKNRIEKRLEGTCEWFLQHKNFKNWIQKDSGPLLVTADPGCGKSVLTKFLVDNWLPGSQTKQQQDLTICYFFFKENDQNTTRQALCALLHQLFSKRVSLIRHAQPLFDKDGEKVIHSTTSLWDILTRAVKDPCAGSIIFVLDALDECAPHELKNLVDNITKQFPDGQRKGSSHRYLLTSRPYDDVLSNFHALLKVLPRVHIPGEEEAESISQEVDLVISHRIQELPPMPGLPPGIWTHLEKRLKNMTHRTYLWVSLIFELLHSSNFKRTEKGIDTFLAQLPKNVQEAYEQILNRNANEEGIQESVRKALSMILVAERPLTLLELNVAMEVNDGAKSLGDLDIEPDENFQARLRAWCGLFVSVHHGKVYLIHQTARQFLLSNATVNHQQWLHSFTLCGAQYVMACVCMQYLELFTNTTQRLSIVEQQHYKSRSHAFLDYAAANWGSHYRDAEGAWNDYLSRLALQLSNPESQAYMIWFPKFWTRIFRGTPEQFPHLMVASYFGHTPVVKVLIEEDAAIDEQDTHGRTSLSWAAANGHVEVVRCLLEAHADSTLFDANEQTPLAKASAHGHELVVEEILQHPGDVDSLDLDQRTPLSLAAANGHLGAAKLLLDQGAKLTSRGTDGDAPLLKAAAEQHEAVVKLLIEHCKQENPKVWSSILGSGSKSYEVTRCLLENGMPVDVAVADHRTLLSWAAEKGRTDIAKVLLDNKADVDARDESHWTPLWWACKNGHLECVELLLDNGACIDAEDTDGRTALVMAARKGLSGVSMLLVRRGASVDSHDTSQQTPLIFAINNGDGDLIELLLDHGASVDCTDTDGWTAVNVAIKNGETSIQKQLQYWQSLRGSSAFDKLENRDERLCIASEKGQHLEVQRLLNHGTSVDVRDDAKLTPLLIAASKGHCTTVKFLVTMKADKEAVDRSGNTALSLAASYGHDATVRFLIEHGAMVNTMDYKNQTPLSHAASHGHEAIVKLLMKNDAKIHLRYYETETPISRAAFGGHIAVVKLLIENGVNVKEKGFGGGRPLLTAAAFGGHEAVVKLLIENGADVGEQSHRWENPLIIAALEGHEAVVKLLIENGADVNAQSRFGRTPLMAAIAGGHQAVVRLLLENGAVD